VFSDVCILCSPFFPACPRAVREHDVTLDSGEIRVGVFLANDGSPFVDFFPKAG
jgi:hypothetical protein